MRLRLEVRRSVLGDETFAVLAASIGDGDERYQLRGGFESLDDAREYARRVLTQYRNAFFGDIIIFDKETPVSPYFSSLSAQELVERLSEISESERSSFWSQQLDGIPKLSAVVVLAYYIWTAFFGGDQVLRWTVALATPIVLVGFVLLNRFRAYIRSRRYSEECKIIADLTISYGWRRESFFPLLVSLEKHSLKNRFPLEVFSGWHYEHVPATFEQVGLQFMFHAEGDNGEEPLDSIAFANRLREEDFEARIQAIVTLSKSKERIIFSPLRCLASSRRAVRRARALISEGLPAQIYLDVAGLPGFDDYRVRSRFAWPVSLFGATLTGATMGWSFLIAPWTGWLGVIAMGSCFVLGTLTTIEWNYKMLQCRGLPKGFAWTDLQGDMRLIRGL